MSLRVTDLWHLPAILMLAVYLPAALFGTYVYRDAYALSFLALLAIFVGSYYLLFPRFVRMLHTSMVRSYLWRIGERVNWKIWAWAAVLVYVITIGIAALTTPATPLGTALHSGSLLDIAEARGDFLANREGSEALLRYIAVILGRSVMPFLVTYAYWSRHRARHVALVALLLCYGISLEKASPIFAFLPLILLRSLQKKWKAAAVHTSMLVLCLGLWTFLAMGGLHDPQRTDTSSSHTEAPAKYTAEQHLHGDPKQYYVFNLVNGLNLHVDGSHPIGRFLWIANRAIWIPYITAYDWLKFQDNLLHGHLTLGRSIGIVSWAMGEPRLKLEQMVYEYQFGSSPGGGGGSNTVFFVDAKLAFGWFGAIIYCALFVFFSAIVFSSRNPVAQIASVTSFFTASVSSLTATLLSGGLLFYLAISVLTRLGQEASPTERAET